MCRKSLFLRLLLVFSKTGRWFLSKVRYWHGYHNLVSLNLGMRMFHFREIAVGPCEDILLLKTVLNDGVRSYCCHII